MRRLILFDIDGTLVSGGPAKYAFETAMVETYGTAGDVAGLSFSGKTDPQIARELLTGAGFDHRAVDEALPMLWERYLAYLDAGLGERPMRVLAGAIDLIETLASVEDVAVGLVTGNIAGGARLKLASAGLWERFAIGGYGSDSEERDLLPGIALERARKHWCATLAAEHAVIVGDTPRDVKCARAGGTRVLAVATGRFSAAELAAAGADHVVEDFTATERVVELLTG
jgi:phosphoglycolate phosphatase-like HAD superfamily hydrolase